VQVAGGAQTAAPVAAGSGSNRYRAARLVVQHLDCLERQAAAGVFHHLEDSEVECFHGDAVNLAHLGFVHMGDWDVAVGEKYLVSHDYFSLSGLGNGL
jgi:hypothetical protein